MRNAIATNPGRTIFATLFAALAGTGIGSLAMSAGVPPAAVMAAQVGVWLAWMLFISIGVSDRFAGMMGMMMACMTPWLIFPGLLEVALVGNAAAAGVIVAAGVTGATLVVVSARWGQVRTRSSTREARMPAVAERHA